MRLLVAPVPLPTPGSLLARHAGVAQDHSYPGAPQGGPGSTAPVLGLRPTALSPHQVPLPSTRRQEEFSFSHPAWSFNLQMNSFHL